MKRLQYDQIKDIITNQLGFKTLSDWKKYLDVYQNDSKKAPPTPEQIALLSPDNVNCIDFWKVCDELFGTDPVCNVSVRSYDGFGSPVEIMEANRRNLWLAESLGIISYLKEFAGRPLVIGEIGTGYGGLRNFIEANTKYQYYGFDVVPRVPGIVQLDERGMFPPSVVALYEKVNFIVSTNVFQHLSHAQRMHYFDEAAKMLVPGGLFMFNTQFDSGFETPMRNSDGDVFMNLYGQFTPTMKFKETQEQLSARKFRLHSYTSRWDGVGSIIAQFTPPAPKVFANQ